MEIESSGYSGDSVRLSPLYEYSGKSCGFSPDGRYILFSHENQIIIIDTNTQKSVFKLFCSDRVDWAEWAPDSKHILGIVRRNKSVEVGAMLVYYLEVFSIEDLSWNVAIQDENYSIISALWTPSCKYLVTSSECNLQTCVWSLSSKTVYFIDSRCHFIEKSFRECIT